MTSVTYELYSSARKSATKWPIGVSRKLFQFNFVIFGSCSCTLKQDFRKNHAWKKWIKFLPFQIIFNISWINFRFFLFFNWITIIWSINSFETGFFFIWETSFTKFDMALTKNFSFIFGRRTNFNSIPKISKNVPTALWKFRASKDEFDYSPGK